MTSDHTACQAVPQRVARASDIDSEGSTSANESPSGDWPVDDAFPHTVSNFYQSSLCRKSSETRETLSPELQLPVAEGIWASMSLDARLHVVEEELARERALLLRLLTAKEKRSIAGKAKTSAVAAD